MPRMNQVKTNTSVDGLDTSAEFLSFAPVVGLAPSRVLMHHYAQCIIAVCLVEQVMAMGKFS